MSRIYNNLEGKFYNHLYHYGYADPKQLKEALSFYIHYFVRCQRVLDVGCGQGEFIELLRDRGISAIGIDVDQQMVEICQNKGLDVRCSDLFDYLPEHKGEFDGIFCSNLVEHLPAADVLRFLGLAFEALSDGGILVVTTPNPESLIVHLYEFWRDPTHVRLYNRSLLEFFMEFMGFKEIESGVNPRTVWEYPTELQGALEFIESEATFQNIGRLFRFLLEPLCAPREIFVKGIKFFSEERTTK